MSNHLPDPGAALPTCPGAILGYTKRGRPIRVIAGGRGDENPYLERLRSRYTKLQEGITGLQSKAHSENRDLTDDELELIRSQGQEGEKLYTQIDELTQLEVRNRSVSDMAAKVFGGGGGDLDDDEGRPTSNASAKDRDPGFYRSKGGKFSYFGDLYRSRMGDEEAGDRLNLHTRALSTDTSGAGVIPPKWMADQYEEALRQGRAVANAIVRVPITDPAPMTLPRQTTTAATEDQSSENDEVHEESPGFSSTTVTVTPRATAGKQTISRQLLESSNPAVDALIFTDLIGDYNDKVEAKVVNAILAAGPAALEANASATDVLAANHFNKVALRGAVAVRRNRKNRRADIYVVSVSRWGAVLEMTDTTGRPLVPAESAGPMNVNGVGTVAVDGRWHGLGIVATEAAEPDEIGSPLEDRFASVYARDVLLFESGIQRFSFEQPKGPESIILAVWAYTAPHIKFGGAGIQTIDVEADESSG